MDQGRVHPPPEAVLVIDVVVVAAVVDAAVEEGEAAVDPGVVAHCRLCRSVDR